MSKTPGTVYLVGAGCGGADMITVRGLRLLERCGVVVYDDLLDKALLEAVPEGAEKIYVGKRQGRHSAAQEEICALLIEKAREGKTVVRLKGGDPFVFGRGGEEMLALRAAGIPCQEVPGVTSAIAVPALAGIPVTHRQISRSVHIITARTADTPGGAPWHAGVFDGGVPAGGTVRPASDGGDGSGDPCGGGVGAYGSPWDLGGHCRERYGGPAPGSDCRGGDSGHGCRGSRTGGRLIRLCALEDESARLL